MHFHTTAPHHHCPPNTNTNTHTHTHAVFTASDFRGDPIETDEMRPEWFEARAGTLPFGEMVRCRQAHWRYRYRGCW